jgi:hypothetical protein
MAKRIRFGPLDDCARYYLPLRRAPPRVIRGPSQWPPPCYRGCELAASVARGWGMIIGGLSIPYATIPMNKRTGITIGGTRYFIIFSFAWRAGAAASLFTGSRRTGAGARSETRSAPDDNVLETTAAPKARRPATLRRENISWPVHWPAAYLARPHLRALAEDFQSLRAIAPGHASHPAAIARLGRAV